MFRGTYPREFLGSNPNRRFEWNPVFAGCNFKNGKKFVGRIAITIDVVFKSESSLLFICSPFLLTVLTDNGFHNFNYNG